MGFVGARRDRRLMTRWWDFLRNFFIAFSVFPSLYIFSVKFWPSAFLLHKVSSICIYGGDAEIHSHNI
jgi:hypothetical protein